MRRSRARERTRDTGLALLLAQRTLIGTAITFNARRLCFVGLALACWARDAVVDISVRHTRISKSARIASDAAGLSWVGLVLAVDTLHAWRLSWFGLATAVNRLETS